LAVAILFVLLNLDISLIIGITGVYAGFIVVYLIPGLINLQCYKNKEIYEAS